MKSHFRVLFLCLIAAGMSIPSAFAQNRFFEANKLYEEGKYAEAARLYEAVSSTEPSAAVFYNLGNAYIKLQSIGRAILSYERALKINPRDGETRANLKYAEKLLEYKIEDKRGWQIRALDRLLRRVTVKECVTFLAGVYFIFIFGCLVSMIRLKRFALGSMGTLALGLVAAGAVVTALKYTNLGFKNEAVVTGKIAEVRYGPSKSDRLAFRLEEGLRAAVTDKKAGWYRIQLVDGQMGWVPDSEITII